MTSSLAQSRKSGERLGFFNYIDESAEPSLYRNGKVLIHRNPNGSDHDMRGVRPNKQKMTVHNGRSMTVEEHCTVSRNGFELLNRPLTGQRVDFFHHQQVVQRYYPQCARIVEEMTGARALVFDHNVRSVREKDRQKRIAGGQAVQKPLHFVHGDYTLTSAPQRLQDLSQPPGINDTLRSVLPANESLISTEMVERSLSDGGRFAIINLWRNIGSEPVATHPLALCDSQSVNPEDLVVFEIHYQDRIGENYFARHANDHRWVYFPEMTVDEALLIKQWDSAGPLARSQGRLGDSSNADAPCTFSFHSAFDDPTTPPDAPNRKSIEVRCIAIYD